MEEKEIEIIPENEEIIIEPEKENMILNVGGTANYNELQNKPQINNVELNGNKTLEELGIKQIYTAADITFTDGQTFQQKYDSGQLKGEPGKDAVIDLELSTTSNNAIANSTVTELFESYVDFVETEKTYIGEASGTGSATYSGFATRIKKPEKIMGIRLYTMLTLDSIITCQILSSDRTKIYAEKQLNLFKTNEPIFVDFIFDNIEELNIEDENIYIAIKSNQKNIPQSIILPSSGSINENLVTANCLDQTGTTNNYFWTGVWSAIKSTSNKFAFTLQFSILNQEKQYFAKQNPNLIQNPKMNYIYVATTGNDVTGDGTIEKPYATIYYANDMIKDNSEFNRYTIKVADGTYTDLQERYAGDISTLGMYQGVVTKDYVYYEGNIKDPSKCIIEWNGATGFDLETYTRDEAVDKTPFHVGRTANGLHTSIRGFKIVGKNLRYAMHCETSGSGYNVDWEISDMILEWYGRPDVIDSENEVPAIGTGSSPFEKGSFKNIKIICNATTKGGISYKFGFQNHDNPNKVIGLSPAVLVGASYKFENILFDDSRVQFRSIHLEQADNFDTAVFFNCKGISEIQNIFASEAIKSNWKIHTELCEIGGGE